MITVRALALCAALLGACSPKHQEGLQLRYKFTPGQTDRYNIDLTVLTTTPDQPPTGRPIPVKGGGTSSVKVDKVNPDGSADVTSAMEDFQIGGRKTVDAAQVSKYVLSPLGVATLAG